MSRKLQGTDANTNNAGTRDVDAACLNLPDFDALAVLEGDQSVLLFPRPDCAEGEPYLIIGPSDSRVGLGEWSGRVQSAHLL
jgi:hypothetical protein